MLGAESDILLILKYRDIMLLILENGFNILLILEAE